MNVKFHKITSRTLIFQNLPAFFPTVFVKFDIHFLGLP